MKKIIRVNMEFNNIESIDIPKELKILGGRALIDHILTNEVDPKIHPLSKNNKLIIAPGLFSATSIPNSARLSIGSKSPLTLGVKEANSGGNFAFKLGRLGIKCIVIEGKSKNSDIFILVVRKDLIFLENANEFKMWNNYDLFEKLKEKYGSNIGIASIGSAGERRLSAATIAISDRSGYPSRHCARGGLGAVMGAKGIKAIVVDDTGGVNRKPMKHEDFQKYVKEVVQFLKNSPRTAFFHTKGTPGIINISNDQRGSLPTHNYQSGKSNLANSLSSDTMINLIEERGGSMGHACMPGCIVKCSNVFFGEDKKFLTSALEYETLVMLGSNLDIFNMDSVAVMDRKCDDYGVDTIEIGSAIGALGEIGYFNFGDKDKAIAFVDEVGSGTLLGRVLGNGVSTTCRVFGIERVPAIKGQAIPGHSPQALKGLAVTYITSPQGADHTAGFIAEDPLSPEGQVERSLNSQINTLLMDSLGFCFFTFLSGNNEIFLNLINSFFDLELDINQMVSIAKNALKEELEFNSRSGISKDGFIFPEFFNEERLPPNDTVFDVSNEKLNNIFKDLILQK